MRSRTYIAIPPGATIKEQLSDRCMSQKEFAARMDMSEKHISKLINGDVQLTPDMAIRLETVLGVPAKFWNNLEAIYREKIIKAESENTIDSDKELAKKLPYKDMAEYGWVPVTRSESEKVSNLRRYFEIVKLGLLEKQQITKITCRRLKLTDKSDLALVAWAQQAKIKARDISTSTIDLKGLQEELPEIVKLTRKRTSASDTKLIKKLAENGIALALIPYLKGSFLKGVTFIDGNHIVVGLASDIENADEFRFGLFHELGHIILGHVTKEGETTEEDEKAADNWANEKLRNSRSK
ncbi:MAG: HigA family addiction module antidote protein [Clostridiales bacterium]|nr:HigA family addiction module antidote protein [Clostridiales bacterium]